jgi:hypothetical protein
MGRTSRGRGAHRAHRPDAVVARHAARSTTSWPSASPRLRLPRRSTPHCSPAAPRHAAPARARGERGHRGRHDGGVPRRVARRLAPDRHARTWCSSTPPREPAALFAVGDRVRFVPIMMRHVERVAGARHRAGCRPPWASAHAGVPVGGPLDAGLAGTLANAMVGNDRARRRSKGASPVGTLRFDAPTFVLTGAAIEATLDGRPLGQRRRRQADRAARSTSRASRAGAVWYLALRGGDRCTPIVLGSREHLVRAGLAAARCAVATRAPLDDARAPGARRSHARHCLARRWTMPPSSGFPAHGSMQLDARGVAAFFGSTWTPSRRLRDRTATASTAPPLRVVASG